jgi:uncharacterized membrane protein
LKSKYTDQQFAIALGRLLRAGVIFSAAVVVIGGIVYLARHGEARPEYRIFRGEPDSFRHISGVLRGAFGASGRAIIQLGLLFLIATPVARVALSVYAFARERDSFYVGVTVLVLALLLYSLWGPHS